MTRADIRQKFRDENPELTQNVISDATINSWLQIADKEICAETYCITTTDSVTFNSAINQQSYDLQALIPKFYAVDDMPGGGVFYDNSSLRKITPGEMNWLRRKWKTDDAGTPIRYWIRGGRYLWFERKPDAVVQIAVDAFLISDDFNQDGILPFNQLIHLTPFHDGLSKYIQWRAKAKVGKTDEAAIAKKDYTSYVAWMKKRVKATNARSVFMRPASFNSGIPRF